MTLIRLGVVTEQTLHQTLVSTQDPDRASVQLIELAIKGGGPDNITCIVADVIGTGAVSFGDGSYAGAAANGVPRPNPVMTQARKAPSRPKLRWKKG